MASRLLTFVVWCAVAGSGLFWGLTLWVQAAPLPEGTRIPTPAAALGTDVSRVLGTVQAPVEEEDSDTDAPVSDGRFKLIGLVRGAGGPDVALIAIDGQPARAWRVGTEVDEGLRLLAVEPRQARLGPAGGPASLTLSLPEEPDTAAGATAAHPARPGAPGATGPALRPGMRPGLRPGQGPAARPGAEQPGMQQMQEQDDSSSDDDE